MPKEKVKLGYRLLHLVTYHPWLKIISLVLAVIVWLYVRYELNKFNY